MTSDKKVKSIQKNHKGNFNVIPIETNNIVDNEVVLKFPLEILKYLGINNKSKNNIPVIHWALTNGVIQLSGKEPHVTIPILSIDKNNFVPHDNNEE